MKHQQEQAERFHALHVQGRPLVLFNIWDAGSARAVAASGSEAIATGSWSVAAAHGFDDNEVIPLALVIANLERISKSVDLPVACDLESGYGSSPSEVAVAATKVVAAGAVGCNLEDQIVRGEGLYDVESQCERIRAARDAAKKMGISLFINARTDTFLKLAPALHTGKVLEEALYRAAAYAGAGADGFFAPGLVDLGLIGELCRRSPLPVNIMMVPDAPAPRQLADLGVARISYGPAPYRQVMAQLTNMGRTVLGVL